MAFLFVFFSAIYTYKLLRFILQKTSPSNPSHLALPSSSESTDEHDVASASSSGSSECNTAPDHFSSETSENDATTHASTSESRKYDVFLSFRGEDTRKTFVDHLYYALQDRQINTYKDDVNLPRGQSIGPSLKKDIKESRIAVVVFSKNYANSSWCLDELAYIMKCKDKKDGIIVMPLFYDVNPSDVRKQNGDFGKAFAKQEAKNTATKANSWRKALVDASNISGWEPINIANGHEAQVIKHIVDKIFTRLCPLGSDVDEDFVGMTDRLGALVSLLGIESNDVRMVGIWGIGGIGKTTLATSFCMKMSRHFHGHCIVGDIREKSSKDGLKKLQEDMLSAICKTKVEVQDLVDGKSKIKNMLGRRKVLILLDDVDNVCQLEALAGRHNWFGSGSRIIITTRDEHLLRKVDEVYHAELLSDDEAIQLFNNHAYNEKKPIEEYQTLSALVVSYANGLPLALKVLGSFLYDKEKKEWMSTLDRLKVIPQMEIVEKLKISYDGLNTVEKDLFLDIACFWRFEYLHEAKEVFEACDYYPDIGLKVLREKALITIDEYGSFDMHDLVQEMAHYVVRGEHPNNPEEHSRVWKEEDIKNMSPTMENNKVRAIQYSIYDVGYESDSSHLCSIVSNMKKLRWISFSTKGANGKDELCYDGSIFHSNELRYINWKWYPGSRPFLDTFKPVSLVVLKLSCSYQEELWEGCKHLPHLKKIELSCMWKLIKIPEFEGAVLKKLTLSYCNKLEEIHPSLGNCTGLEYVSIHSCPKLRKLPTFVHMKNLKTLMIFGCGLRDGEIPYGIGELFNLQELVLRNNNFSRLDFSLLQLTQLKHLDLSHCRNLIEIPELPLGIAILKVDDCPSLSLTKGWYKSCEWLCQFTFLNGKITNDGGILLHSMLEGNAIENGGSMLLELQGVEIPKVFTPAHLVKGGRCRLELPENWCNDFSGFLICLVFTPTPILVIGIDVKVSTSSVNDQGMDDEDEVVWEESEGDPNEHTVVGYVSFGALRDTTWWKNQLTYKVLRFEFRSNLYDRISGCGVKLIDKKSRTGLTESSSTTLIDSSGSPYTPELTIKDDSASALRIYLGAYLPEEFKF